MKIAQFQKRPDVHKIVFSMKLRPNDLYSFSLILAAFPGGGGG